MHERVNGAASTGMGVLRVLLTALLSAQVAAAQQPRIAVGPNVLVSWEHEREGSLWEVMVAASPTNPKLLLGGGMFSSNRENTVLKELRGYVSSDGGYSWRMVRFPEQGSRGGGDPQVAFGSTGTAYFVGLESVTELRRFSVMNVYRSQDGGTTWVKSASLGTTDHPQIVVDHTTGRFAGRVYVAMNRDGIRMFFSRDDGRSWVGPMDVARREDSSGARIPRNVLVFSDGELFVPFIDYPTGATSSSDRIKFGFSRSSDGGATFTPAQRLRAQGGDELAGALVSGPTMSHGFDEFPVLAVDNSNGRFRDRIYVVWPDGAYRPGRPTGDRHGAPPKGTRLLLSYSVDRGRSWTKPIVISPGRPGVDHQYGATVAVNREGTLGVAWYDTRDTPRGARAPHVHRYFTASVDGGETFLPARPVSSAATDLGRVSRNAVSGAMRIGTSIRLQHGGFTDHSGGHYLGLAADAEGTFHPFWPDGRTGSYQLWTAQVRVERLGPGATTAGDVAAGGSGAAAGGAAPAPAPKLVRVEVTKLVEVVLEPLRRAEAGGVLELPVRLKNTSDQPLYGPITAEVIQLVPAGTLLDGANGPAGVGATVDYSRALGDLEALAPGAITEAVLWRFRPPAMLSGLDGISDEHQPELPRMTLKVTAQVAEPVAK